MDGNVAMATHIVDETEADNAALADFVTPDDIPPNGKVCYRCGGFGLVLTWAGMMETPEECPDCDGDGYRLPATA